jgi:hypothetical protein
MKKPLLAALLLGTLLAARPAAAAPIQIVAQLDPGQSGPVYSWSLLISVEPGYDVGAVDLLTSGFDSFVPNAANPGIGILDTAYVQDPLGDGRNGLVLNNYANGIAIAAGGSQDVLLGTFYGPATSSPPVLLWDGEYEYGGTVFDPYLRTRPPEEASLSAYPLAVISFAAIGVPESRSTAVLCAVALAGLAVLRTARRRVA